MSDTTSPPSVHLYPLSSSSSMSSTDSTPQSEPTSDEQPDLGAFTTVLRAWTYLQPPPRIPVQIHSPTTSTTTTFQRDQSVMDSDFQSSSNVPPLPSSSSFTRPTSSSAHEESTVWNHAPIASYLYSATPSIERMTDEDENSVGSTEEGRTVEITSEWSLDDSVPPRPAYPDVPFLLLPIDTSSPDDSELIVSQRPLSTTTTSSASLNTPQQQHRTVPIHPPPSQSISDDASVSHLSLPPTDPPFPDVSTDDHPPQPYINSLQQQPPLISLLQRQPPRLCMETSTATSSPARGVGGGGGGGGGGQGTIIIDDLRTPDQTPDSFLTDWKRGSGFRPVDDDHEEEEEIEKRKSRAYGLGFGFGRVQQTQGRGQGQKYVSGYTSNYEGSQSSFRKLSTVRSRSTRLEPQNEDNEDSNINPDVAEHQDEDEDQDQDHHDEDEEEDDYPFPHYRGRRSDGFHSQSHTPRYYGTHTPPRGVLPTQPSQQSMRQTQTDISRGLVYDHNQSRVQPQSYTDSHQQFYSHHPDPHSYPDPYPRPHARPLTQNRNINIYSSHSATSSLPSSPPGSHIELSPIQRDYVLIQPQTQLQLFSQQTQPQPQTRSQLQQAQSQTQVQTSHPISYLSTQNQGSIIYSSTTTALPLPASVVSIPPSSAVVSIPPSAITIPASSTLYPNVYQGKGAVTSEDSDSPLLVLLSSPDNHDHPSPPPPSTSSASTSSAFLSKTIGKAKNAGATDKPDQSDKASWECVDLEEDELVSVSVSGRSSSINGDGGGGGGLGLGAGVGVGSSSGSGVDLDQPSLKLQQPPSTKEHQRLTEHSSTQQMKQQQQQRRQLETQFQQHDVQTRLHVESDSGGSEDGGGTTIAGASVSELITTTTAIAASITTTTDTTTTTSQPPNPNLNPIPNQKSHPRTNNHPKHLRSHSYSHGSYQGFLSDSHVAHIEDTTESEIELELDDDAIGGDVGVSTNTVRPVAEGGVDGGGDSLLPSLGYLDEALSFIAAERARWSAAREGGTGSGLTKATGKTTEDWKVLDHGVDTPKRKRRRKRPSRQQQQQQNVLPNSSQGVLEAPPPPPSNVPLNASHAADEDGPPPSTSTPSTKKKKKARSSSWSRSPAKKKSGSVGSNKGKEKEFLIAPQPQPQPPVVSDFPPLLLPTVVVQDELATGSGAGVVVPRSRPDELLVVRGQGSSKHDEDGGRTPTNGSVVEDVFGPVSTASTSLSGKREKRLGKKERERERVEKDSLIGKSEVVAETMTSRGRAVDGIEYEEDDDNQGDNDDEDDDDDDDLSHDDSSLNDLSILQPPRSRLNPSRRQKGKDIAHIHNRAGVAGGGAYKSTPGSPKRRREFDDIPVDRESGYGHGQESLGEDMEDHVGVGDGVVPDMTPITGKKRAPTKRAKGGLVRVRSVPQLCAEEPALYAVEERITPGKTRKARLKAASTSILAPAPNGSGSDFLDMGQPQTKRSRLLALAKKLREFFPEQRQELRRVTIRLEKQGIEAPGGKVKKAFLTSGGGHGGSTQLIPKSLPISVPGVIRLKRTTHLMTGSESASADIDDDSIEGGDAAAGDGIPEIEEEDEEELDPRGRPPRKSDVLIHVFVDHSNILIGLLSHLKRFPLCLAGSKGTKQDHPLPIILAKAAPTASMSHVTTSALAFAAVKPTSARPLPNPNLPMSGNGKASANTSPSSSIPIAVPGNRHHPIPLPSFATVSRSLPSGSALNEYLVENDDGSQTKDKVVHSDSNEYHEGEDEDVDELGQFTSLGKACQKPKEKEKKLLKHLWHAALVLLLERGRSITRRVIVTSSPLYQPMDGIERLGYELRVYVRVPDLGNGMDRDRRRDRSGSLTGGNKSAQSSPANAVSLSGLPSSLNKKQISGHVRHVSGSTSAESGSGGGGGGSGGGGSGNASGGGASNLHPYYGIANNTPSQGKIKYREQGVDELLQLKLHQALAATDDVPEGSTIVLATGDGNMGQFNEEGFLGPVRTALRHGWKVELYAWEDGLSRAWRREFGEGTEWGRKGMFRVIGMEQFAASLVEVIDQ